jgi:hypothetical protein
MESARANRGEKNFDPKFYESLRKPKNRPPLAFFPFLNIVGRCRRDQTGVKAESRFRIPLIRMFVFLAIAPASLVAVAQPEGIGTHGGEGGGLGMLDSGG